MDTPYAIATVVTVPPQRIQDMVVGAFEGGSNYWLTGQVTLVKPWLTEMPKCGVVWYGNPERNIFAEESFEVALETDEGRKLLTRETVQKGLELMATLHRDHFNDLVNENDDATTSDVFLQLCLFEEVVYG